MSLSHRMCALVCSRVQAIAGSPTVIARAFSSTMTNIGDKFKLPERFVGTEYNMWNEYNVLAAEYKPVNLGQGFPDFLPPDHVIKNLEEVAKQQEEPLLHQYSRGFGATRLVNVLGKMYSKAIGRELNPLTELLVTSGAYEALVCAIRGHTCPGDEVILVEPFFDCYAPLVQQADGIPVYIPLRLNHSGNGPISSSDWQLDPEELSSKFNEKTKMIIMNTPHNPLGKVFTEKELLMVADLCKKWNVLYLSDEVYEWLVYKPNQHVRACTLPGMWDRTITIGSAGKTFSATGWKTGWAYGPANLIRNLNIVHQNNVNSNNTPVQEAIARSLEFEMSRWDKPDCYMVSLSNDLLSKRDYMVKFLTEVGMRPVIPDGGYFIIVDWSPLADRANYNEEKDANKDFRFSKWMTKNLRLLGIPPTGFYSESNKHIAENYIRFCFIKGDDKLQEAERILKQWVASS